LTAMQASQIKIWLPWRCVLVPMMNFNMPAHECAAVIQWRREPKLGMISTNWLTQRYVGYLH